MYILLDIGYSYLLMLLFCSALFGQSNQRQITLSETEAVYGYYEYLPDGYNEAVEDFPLIIYLHGRGETGNGGSDLWKVKENGPNRLIEQGKAFPAIILSPQSADYWDIDSLNAFVDWAFENYRADTARLYITGISMGGAAVWLYASAYPEKPAAIVPISGDAKAKDPENLIDMGVWAFHNENDHVVEVELTYEWVGAIKEAGGDPKVTIYNKSGHDAWTETYDNEDMWKWMFAQGPELPPLQASGSIATMKIYPNPFKDRITIDHPVQLLSAKMYNLHGKTVARWSSAEWGKGTTTSLSLGPDILPGHYVLELRSVHGIKRFKIIKE